MSEHPGGWHPDPSGRHELRYWDGREWTEHVSDRGITSLSPLQPPAPMADSRQGAPAGVDADQNAHGPAPRGPSYPGYPGLGGTTAHTAHTGHPPGGGAPSGGFTDTFSGNVGGDIFGGISGELIDGRFAEIDGAGPQLQNQRMLRVRVTEPFLARQGSMVAYQGNVDFAFQGGGAGRFLKKALTGEGLSLMRVGGQGDVFLADEARHLHLLHLNNSGLSVNGRNVLAFSASLEWNVERVRGGSIAAGGLFNTALRGSGWVAISTDGEPVVLNAGEAATFTDSDAVVAWSLHLQTSLRSTFTAGALVGRGSGEAFQVAFQGEGFVIVQPSEGRVTSR